MNGLPKRNYKLRPKFTTFQYQGKRGITDLKNSSPYDEYGSFASTFPDVTEEEYRQNPKAYEARVRIWNRNYVNSLRLEGIFGTEYTVDIKSIHNPAFDTPVTPTSPPLSSYNFIMIDFSDDK